MFFFHDTWGMTKMGSSLEALHVHDIWGQKADGAAYKEAINMCIEAVQGKRSHQEARRAFLIPLTEGGVDIEARE